MEARRRRDSSGVWYTLLVPPPRRDIWIARYPEGFSFWKVGYEDPASFRRLIKRMTRITPHACRRNFRVPEFARAKTRKPGGA